MPPESPRVLVVEDDPDTRDVLAELLEAEGYDVRSAANADEGLLILQDWQPRVVILDLLLKESDGWAFRAKQRRSQAVGNIPVIVLSAAHNPQVEELAPAAVLKKPFELHELLHVVAHTSE